MRVFLTVLLSLGIVSIISAGLGFAFLLVGINFWITFACAAAAQLVAGACWNTWVDAKTRLQRLSIASTQRLAETVQVAELSCAYCGVKNKTEIFVTRENSFDCINCNSTNKVQVSINTVRVTEPVVKDKVLSKIFQKMQEAPEVENVDNISDEKIKISGGKNG